MANSNGLRGPRSVSCSFPPELAVQSVIYAWLTPLSAKLLPPHHDIVANLLVSCLSPIATHRANLHTTTKTRSKKRKRKANRSQAQPPAQNVQLQSEDPTPPEITRHISVGFNSVTRHLEELSKFSKMTAAEKTKASHAHIAAIFLFRPMDELLYSHLPTLCCTASLAHPELPPIRLVLLDSLVEGEVTAAMALAPGVSMLAVHDCAHDGAGTKTLIDYVRQNVDVVQVNWLKQAVEAQWLGTRMDLQ